MIWIGTYHARHYRLLQAQGSVYLNERDMHRHCHYIAVTMEANAAHIYYQVTSTAISDTGLLGRRQTSACMVSTYGVRLV
jgi:virulence-associated protein VapD